MLVTHHRIRLSCPKLLVWDSCNVRLDSYPLKPYVGTPPYPRGTAVKHYFAGRNWLCALHVCRLTNTQLLVSTLSKPHFLGFTELLDDGRGVSCHSHPVIL